MWVRVLWQGEGRKDTSGFEFRIFSHENASLSPIYTRKWIALCRLFRAATGLILVSDKRSVYVLGDNILFKPLPSSEIEVKIPQGGSDKFENCAI